MLTTWLGIAKYQFDKSLVSLDHGFKHDHPHECSSDSACAWCMAGSGLPPTTLRLLCATLTSHIHGSLTCIDAFHALIVVDVGAGVDGALCVMSPTLVGRGEVEARACCDCQAVRFTGRFRRHARLDDPHLLVAVHRLGERVRTSASCTLPTILSLHLVSTVTRTLRTKYAYRNRWRILIVNILYTRMVK